MQDTERFIWQWKLLLQGLKVTDPALQVEVKAAQGVILRYYRGKCIKLYMCICICPHQSLCHGGLILPREMLLQGQDNTVGSDGGQDHVLKWCKGHKVKESAFITTQEQQETSDAQRIWKNNQRQINTLPYILWFAY